jgi:hypothetical protein
LETIDGALREYSSRRLVPSTEVVDLLLDLRSMIVLDADLSMVFDDLEVRDDPASCRAR